MGGSTTDKTNNILLDATLVMLQRQRGSMCIGAEPSAKISKLWKSCTCNSCGSGHGRIDNREESVYNMAIEKRHSKRNSDVSKTSGTAIQFCENESTICIQCIKP
jgi:hypothetical protein